LSLLLSQSSVFSEVGCRIARRRWAAEMGRRWSGGRQATAGGTRGKEEEEEVGWFLLRSSRKRQLEKREREGKRERPTSAAAAWHLRLSGNSQQEQERSVRPGFIKSLDNELALSLSLSLSLSLLLVDGRKEGKKGGRR
jgi:hypothetical protein